MRCQSCGREIPAHARFCGHCGASIPAPTPASPPGGAEPDAPATVMLPHLQAPAAERAPAPSRPTPEPAHPDPVLNPSPSPAADPYLPWQAPSNGHPAPAGRPPTQQSPAPQYAPTEQYSAVQAPQAPQQRPDDQSAYAPRSTMQYPLAAQPHPSSFNGPPPWQAPPRKGRPRLLIVIGGLLAAGLAGLIAIVAIGAVVSNRAAPTPTVQPSATVVAIAKPVAATAKPAPSPTVTPRPSPTPVPQPTRVPVSLENGTDITPPVPGPPGLGKLTIQNGTSRDAVAKLVIGTADPKTWQTRRYVYVKANNTVVMEGIPVGTYRLAYMSGVDWDVDARKFLREVSASQFDEPFDFKEEQTERGTRFSTWEVSFNPVAGGTGKTTSLPEGAFGPE